MKEQKWIIGIVVAVLAAAGIFFSLSTGKSPKELAKEVPLTPFGQYLKDSGVKFHGAEWCPHCQNMKQVLGDGAWQAVYIECSPKGTKVIEQCVNAKIEAFPTFELKNGERKVGELSLDEFEEFVGYKGNVGAPQASSTIVDVK